MLEITDDGCCTELEETSLEEGVGLELQRLLDGVAEEEVGWWLLVSDIE